MATAPLRTRTVGTPHGRRRSENRRPAPFSDRSHPSAAPSVRESWWGGRRRAEQALLRPALAALALLSSASLAACDRPDDRLVVADGANMSSQDMSSVKLWAVTPGEKLGKDSVVAPKATGPVSITTRTADGDLWANTLARAWKGKVLLGSSTQAGSKVTAGDPGARQTTLASAEKLAVQVVSRGVLISDSTGCSLATDVERAQRVGIGSCAISDDDRWVASWPNTGGNLHIRDLRSNDTRTVKGTFGQAVPLARDARVLGITQTRSGSQARLIDASSGDLVKVVVRGDAMRTFPPSPGAEGVMVLSLSGNRLRLTQVGTDGNTTTVAQANSSEGALWPVDNVGGVHFLRFGSDPRQAELMFWRQGQVPRRIARGELTATPLGDGELLVTLQSDDRIEFWHAKGGSLGEDPLFSLPTTTASHASLTSVIRQGDTVHAQVEEGNGSSYVRLELGSGTGSAPVRNWAAVSLQGLDTDGTALLIGSRTQASGSGSASPLQLMTVGPDDSRPETWAHSANLGTALIKDATIYYTVMPSNADPSIRTVEAKRSGDGGTKLLYPKALVAGAVWPEFGGGVEVNPVDGVELASQAQGGSQGGTQDGSQDGSAQDSSAGGAQAGG